MAVQATTRGTLALLLILTGGSTLGSMDAVQASAPSKSPVEEEVGRIYSALSEFKAQMEKVSTTSFDDGTHWALEMVKKLTETGAWHRQKERIKEAAAFQGALGGSLLFFLHNETSNLLSALELNQATNEARGGADLVVPCVKQFLHSLVVGLHNASKYIDADYALGLFFGDVQACGQLSPTTQAYECANNAIQAYDGCMTACPANYTCGEICAKKVLQNKFTECGATVLWRPGWNKTLPAELKLKFQSKDLLQLPAFPGKAEAQRGAQTVVDRTRRSVEERTRPLLAKATTEAEAQLLFVALFKAAGGAAGLAKGLALPSLLLLLLAAALAHSDSAARPQWLS